jgi:hypothetical protein
MLSQSESRGILIHNEPLENYNKRQGGVFLSHRHESTLRLWNRHKMKRLYLWYGRTGIEARSLDLQEVEAKFLV